MQNPRVMFAALLFTLSAAAVFLDHRPTDAEEARLVRILGGIPTGEFEPREPVRLEPPITTVSRGEVVIWLNWARNAECVKVVFEDGKRCDDVTDAATGFAMSGDCYVTSWITLGGTSSLRFKETGTFAYTVEMKTGAETRKGSGKIIVRED